ncbi:MAG: hypothetical protein Ct9H300mP22_3040 [Gammaproteobacteria bacterium]|nr:MAG: hypothetical protein Ct9H300mP22_3040 [Gammaproteobacteria bacterium]
MFDESLPACEDYDLWLRICSRYPVLYVKEKLLRKYGGHEDQLRNNIGEWIDFVLLLFKRLLNEDALNESQKTAATEMLITKSKILISGAEKRGKRRIARTNSFNSCGLSKLIMHSFPDINLVIAHQLEAEKLINLFSMERVESGKV